MQLSHDQRVIMTFDTGGTNFRFSLPKRITLLRYRYCEPERNRADVKINPEEKFRLRPSSAELNDALPPNSLTIYSTYQLNHKAPGVIAETKKGLK